MHKTNQNDFPSDIFAVETATYTSTLVADNSTGFYFFLFIRVARLFVPQPRQKQLQQLTVNWLYRNKSETFPSERNFCIQAK